MQINRAYDDPGVIVNDNYDNSANITVLGDSEVSAYHSSYII